MSEKTTRGGLDILTGPVARVLYALPFLLFGAMHLMRAAKMAAYVPHWVPGGVFWVYLTGAAMIAAALAIIFGKMARLAGLLLALLLLVYVLAIHVPGLGSANAMMKQMQMIGLLKDTSLMAGALMVADRFKG